jgi:hypothetical protein
MINTKQTCFPGSSGWFENNQISADELRLKNLPKTARRVFSRITFISVAEKFNSRECNMRLNLRLKLQRLERTLVPTILLGTSCF